jgi:hypothetical protein
MTSSSLPFVHLTFRDAQGRLVRLDGLQWECQEPPTRFVVKDDQINLDNLRGDIVQAYNRWGFAKDLPFRTEQDVGSLSRHGQHHVQVEWKDAEKGSIEKVIKQEDIEKLLRSDTAAKAKGPPADAWVNGVFVGTLNNGPTPPSTTATVDKIMDAIPTEPANKVRYKRSEGRIRIERYYWGALRRPHAWDHVWDCLVALEDPEPLDGSTFSATATLRD